jgi:hypothetical protein
MATTSDLLRPMRVGDILDGAIRLYRSNFRLLVGIAAWVYVPLCFLTFVFSPMTYTVLVMVVSGFLLPAVATIAISERILNRKISVIGSYIRVGKRLFTLIGAMLLVVMLVLLIILGASIVFGILIAFLSSSAWGMRLPRTLTIIVIMPVMVFSALTLSVRLLFTLQAVVIEGSKATRAIGRSMELAKGSFWKILIVLISVFMAIFLINSLFGFVGGAVVAVLGRLSAVWFFISRTGIINLLLQPFQIAVIVLLYYDTRVRKEGYDLEVMAQELAVE